MKNRDIIVIDGKIVTNKVSYCKYDESKGVWQIRYNSSNFPCEYPKNRVKVVNVLSYMREVSLFSAKDLKYQNGENIITSLFDKMEVNGNDTALANYLKLSSDTIKGDLLNLLIFPFGCNYSQYIAVENAMNGKISVIEGPPGTGKTQTILNIIANIIIRGMNCQVVSNNNAAVENVDEKLKNYNLNFMCALLGKKENKESFVRSQTDIPDLSEFKDIDVANITKSLNEKKDMVRKIYNTKIDIANLTQKKNELALEYRYFEEYVKKSGIKLIVINFSDLNMLKKLFNEIVGLEMISVWTALKFIIFYKVGNLKIYKNDISVLINSIKNAIYVADLEELNNQIKAKQKFINDNLTTEQEFVKLSMLYLKNYLSRKYLNGRKNYDNHEIRRQSEKFLQDYPVVLSTTYSSKNSINAQFDYIIMDESSQIDVVTGTLALSTAKYAVIIGDEKQLPNVIKPDVKFKASLVFNKYNVDKGYSYTLNSFLSSVKRIVLNMSVTLLKEHYRCHPKIINFCNQEFYNNDLVIMTKDLGEKDVIKVIRTADGNHARGKINLRQVDIIKELVLELDGQDCGIIAPYNDQVDLIRMNIPNLEVYTVHKFQGREKDVIIISTVDDVIREFVANPNLLNVAISRAKKKLIFILSSNDIVNRTIQDFLDYVDYNNMEITKSKIYSVFDILYKQNELERLNFFKRHNRILKYDSENIIYYLLKSIVSEYKGVDFLFYQSLNELIYDKSLLTTEELKYISHYNTHVDFVIFNKNTKKAILVVEVDGYKFHKLGTKQYERDQMKNTILKKYNIPLIRLATNGSKEKEKIREKLDSILKH